MPCKAALSIIRLSDLAAPCDGRETFYIFFLHCHCLFDNKVHFLMVGVAQLVEHLVVAQVVVGSSPITHPI